MTIVHFKEGFIMAKGATGTNTSTIVYRRQKAVPSKCSECRNLRIVDGQKLCMATGDYLLRTKTSCLYYSGPYISRKKPAKKAKHTKISKHKKYTKLSGSKKKHS